MLYCELTAENESEALDKAEEKLRLNRADLVIASVREVDGGKRYRIEAGKSRGQEAHDILEKILRKICPGCQLFYIDSLDKIALNISGSNLGLIIGKNGATLEALETIVGAMHNKGYEYYKPVVINPGGYKENKKKFLKSLVRRAVDAASGGNDVSLPPMCRLDRKEVHQILGEYPGFESRSVGEGNNRKVLIYRIRGGRKIQDNRFDASELEDY